jgi:hypothetical protein
MAGGSTILYMAWFLEDTIILSFQILSLLLFEIVVKPDDVVNNVYVVWLRRWCSTQS